MVFETRHICGKKKKRNKNFFVSAINPTGVSPRRGESILGSAHLPETPF